MKLKQTNPPLLLGHRSALNEKITVDESRGPLPPHLLFFLVLRFAVNENAITSALIVRLQHVQGLFDLLPKSIGRL